MRKPPPARTAMAKRSRREVPQPAALSKSVHHYSSELFRWWPEVGKAHVVVEIGHVPVVGGRVRHHPNEFWYTVAPDAVYSSTTLLPLASVKT
jgi:hypothetical protein